MLKVNKNAFVGLAVATLLAAGTGVGTAVAREQTTPTPDKFALGEDEVKQLLLLLDQDKNGKVSRQEFRQFMDAEFDRLDRDKSGELDVKELTRSQVQASHAFTAVGK
jgi:Ca2+-binding EF-hand superfamily protein